LDLKSASFAKIQFIKEVLCGIANNVASHSILDASKDGFVNSILVKNLKRQMIKVRMKIMRRAKFNIKIMMQ